MPSSGAGCSLGLTPLGLGWNKGPPTSDKWRVQLASWARRGDAWLEPHGSAELLEATGILIGKKRELLSPDLR